LSSEQSGAGPPSEGPPRPAPEVWAENQRALARALGLSIEEWLGELDRAAQRKTGLLAAAVGAATAQKLGLSVLDQLDGAALAARARALIDPTPPKVDNPLLREAIRRAGEGGPSEGGGASRLKKSREPLPTPPRTTASLGPSSGEATPDAPGADREED
jgi:hypothetical protein